MQKNVGTVDASIRITLGLLGLAYGIGKMSRRPYRTPWLLMAMSAMKVAEGVTRYCPMLAGMGINTRTENGLAAAKNRIANVGNNFMASQISQFAKAVTEDNQQPASNNIKTQGEHLPSDQPPVDFDLDEVVSKAISQAVQPTASTQATQAASGSREQTRHVRTRENVRENMRRPKSQTSNYKQDESTYPTYS